MDEKQGLIRSNTRNPWSFWHCSIALADATNRRSLRFAAEWQTRLRM